VLFYTVKAAFRLANVTNVTVEGVALVPLARF